MTTLTEEISDLVYKEITEPVPGVVVLDRRLIKKIMEAIKRYVERAEPEKKDVSEVQGLGYEARRDAISEYKSNLMKES